jgi:hippurate hydrolase
VGDLIENRIATLPGLIAQGYGCEARVRYLRRYPATVNDSEKAELAREAARSGELAVADTPASMAAEDFAFMLEQVEGCYAWLGSGRIGENPMLHSPQFDFNNAVFPAGLR